MAHTGETVDPQEIDGKIAQIDEKVARLSCLQEELERQRPGKDAPPAAKPASRKMPSAVSAASGCNRKTNQEQDARKGKNRFPRSSRGALLFCFGREYYYKKEKKRCLHTNSIKESAAFLQKRLGDFQPELLLILGSGLGFLAGEVEGPWSSLWRDPPLCPFHSAGSRRAAGVRHAGRTPGDGDGWPLPHLRRL